MENIIYIKKLDDYDEIINCKLKLSVTLKKIIFLYKNIFNIITKQSKDEFNIWVLPFQEKISDNKLNKIIDKQIKRYKITENTRLVVSKSLLSKNMTDILRKYNINYFNGNLIKKILIFKVLDYINNLQNKELNKRNITILVNEDNNINKYIIKNIALNSKTTKIVSKKINKFKSLEEELYNEYGVAIQFSNSNKKSLSKSEIIINLDFDEVEVNEYDINNNAIIINTKNSLKVKSKLFNGIVINSYEIKFIQKLKNKFNKNNFLNRYDNLILYESIIDWKNANDKNIIEKIEEDNIKIINLIGNNGIINKKEFKIIENKNVENIV